MNKLLLVISCLLFGSLSADQDSSILEMDLTLFSENSAAVVEINSIEELNQFVTSANTPVFVDCYSNHCSLCRVLS